MTSKQFDPRDASLRSIPNNFKLKGKREKVPFMRKLLIHPLSDHQKVELTISKLLLNNKHTNVVNIYAIKEPKSGSHGHIDMELLEPFGEKKDIYIDNLDMLDGNVTAGLKHLHSLCVVYIDLHVDNVGWSMIDNCWKIFDFNNSGVLDSVVLDSGPLPKCLNKWKMEPSHANIYNKIIDLFNETHDKIKFDKIKFDDAAKNLFDEEKKKVELKTRCIECNKATRNSVSVDYEKDLENCRMCREWPLEEARAMEAEKAAKAEEKAAKAAKEKSKRVKKLAAFSERAQIRAVKKWAAKKAATDSVVQSGKI